VGQDAASSPGILQRFTLALGEAVQDTAAMAQAREAQRQRKGCVEIPNMECVVRVGDLKFDASEDDLDIAVQVIAPHESASRQMVKEAMVLAGEIAALWGGEHKVPLLYRCACRLGSMLAWRGGLQTLLSCDASLLCIASTATAVQLDRVRAGCAPSWAAEPFLRLCAL